LLKLDRVVVFISARIRRIRAFLSTQFLVHSLGQLQPNIVIHGLAPDVGDLLAGQIRHIFELWHSLDQIIDGKCSGFVTGLGTVPAPQR
jgi:hypothetical protein